MPKSMNKFNTLACCCAIFSNFQGKKCLFLLKTIDFMNKFDKKNYLCYIRATKGKQNRQAEAVCLVP